MSNIPNEIEKIKIDMNKCFDIYKTLEDFSYRFSKEEMDKRWNIVGSPKIILELIIKR